MRQRPPMTRLWFLTQALRQSPPEHAMQLMLSAPSLIPGINLSAPRPGEYADRLKLVERPRRPHKARKENK